MILSDTMMQTALDFRKAEPWKTLTDSDLFAVQLSDGTLAYCVTTGNGGEHHAFGCYKGTRGLASYIRSLRDVPLNMMMLSDLTTSMEYLSCEFDEENELPDKEKETLAAFLHAHKLTAAPSHGWPLFKCFYPGKRPFNITKEQDAGHIVEAMKAAIHIADLAKSSSTEEIGFDPDGEYLTEEGGKDIPLLITQPDGSYELSSMKQPKVVVDDYPSPVFEDQRITTCIWGLPRRGKYQCKDCYIPLPITDAADGVPCFPDVIMFIEMPSKTLDIVMAEQSPTNIQALLSSFGEKIIQTGKCPSTIIVADVKTQNLLTDFCEKCGISLRVQRYLPLIADAFKILSKAPKSK